MYFYIFFNFILFYVFKVLIFNYYNEFHTLLNKFNFRIINPINLLFFKFLKKKYLILKFKV